MKKFRTEILQELEFEERRQKTKRTENIIVCKYLGYEQILSSKHLMIISTFRNKNKHTKQVCLITICIQNFLLLLLYFRDRNTCHFLRQTCHLPGKGYIKQELHCLGISINIDLEIILLNIIYNGYVMLQNKFGTERKVESFEEHGGLLLIT